MIVVCIASSKGSEGPLVCMYRERGALCTTQQGCEIFFDFFSVRDQGGDARALAGRMMSVLSLPTLPRDPLKQ